MPLRYHVPQLSCVSTGRPNLKTYGAGVGGIGVRVHGGRVREGVMSVAVNVLVRADVGVSGGVGVPVSVGVKVRVGIKVSVGVLVSVGVYVAGNVGSGVPVGSGGFKGLIATRGFTKINNCAMHTITTKTTTTRVAI